MSNSDTHSKNHPETPGATADHHVMYSNSLDYEAGTSPDGSPISPRVKLYRHWRSILREPAAEFLGTMILVVFGLGVNCQSSLSNNKALIEGSSGSPATAVMGWATGVAMGVWVSADISGGHINPVVTLVLALFRGFSWKKVPGYFAAQTLGAFFGSLLVYGNYYSAIDIVDKAQPGFPGTAALFGTYPVPYVSNGSAFFSEFLLTFMFILAVLAITRPGKKPHPRGLVSFGLFVAFLGLNSSLGMQTSFTLNPARDLGPRIMTWIFYGRQVWNFRSQYWLYTNIMGPFAGGIAAAAMHDLFIHHDDPKEEVLPTKNAPAPVKA